MNRPEPKTRLTAGAKPSAPAESRHDAAEPPQARLSHKQIRNIYFGLIVAMGLSALNQTIVATALPSIGRHFNDIENLTWVITAYLLTATVASPLYGKLSDIYGRRAVMLAAIGIFVAGSAACAAAPNMAFLILGRALQGIGGGGIVPVVQSTIADIVTPRERGRYQAYMATVWISAGVGGPVLGGFLADHFHWSVIFWINIPLGLIAATLSYHQLKRLPRHDRWHKLDILGACLMMASAGALLLALTWGGTRYPWLSFQIIALIVSSGGFAAAFGWHLTRAEEPFLPISILANPVMRMGTAANSLAFSAQLGLTVFLPLYYQLVHQLPATEAGMALIPSVVFTTPGSIVVGRVMMHFPRYKWAATIGMLGAVAALSLLVIWPDMSIGGVMGAMGVVAFGVGTLFPCATVCVQNSVPHHQVGTATGTINFFRSLVSALVVAIMGAIMLYGFGFTAGRGAAAAVMVTSAGGIAATPGEVFRWVFGTADVFFIASLCAWLLMEERPLAGPEPRDAAGATTGV